MHSPVSRGRIITLHLASSILAHNSKMACLLPVCCPLVPGVSLFCASVLRLHLLSWRLLASAILLASSALCRLAPLTTTETFFFSFIETGSHIFQAELELTVWLRMTSNF